MIKITTFSGTALAKHIPDLARLRIQIFREFPYLFEGSVEYEEKHLESYSKSEHAVIVLALDKGKVIGASTAIPLQYAEPAFQQPFLDKGIDISRIFHCGESLLQKEYRGQGVGHRFFDERENHARQQGFEQMSFCAVQRPDNHLHRPADYRPLDNFWRKRGYQPQPDMVVRLSWRDIGQKHASEKTMGFWLKDLMDNDEG